MDYIPTSLWAKHSAVPGDIKANITEISKRHVEIHIKAAELYKKELEDLFGSGTKGVPALTTIAVNSMVNSLREDPSPGNFRTVLKHTPPTLLPSIVDSPKLHYTSMLQFMRQQDSRYQRDDSTRDIWILKNEYFIRADGTDWGLCNLDDADIIFQHCSEVVNDEQGNPLYRAITRKLPPTAGFNYLDQKRQRVLKIQPSTSAYKKAFDRLMHGALDGLDWNNVFVAGGMALASLFCVDESYDKQYESNDIDMYIYGLTPSEANKKIKHIAEIWQQNIQNDNGDRTMIKNAKTVTLISKYPNRRIQIILRIIKNPAAVLLNFDLDQVAIGYNGESVVFLPRCARALETGYTIFTLDLIYGHHLTDRRETTEERLFKYAKAGFGVRLLPEFCSMVEVDFENRSNPEALPDQAPGEVLEHRRHRRWRREDDPEHREKDLVAGLKALKRIFCLGEDMVHRFFLGRTETTRPDSDDEWDEMEDEDEAQVSAGGATITDSITGETKKVPYAQFSELDTHRSGVGCAHGKRGLGGLELHARHCGLVRFEHEQKMVVQYDTLASSTYDNEAYDQLPKYKWDQDFSAKSFAKSIDRYNDSLFDDLIYKMSALPGFPRSAVTRVNMIGYLTRRIRRMTHSSQNIQELLERYQLVVPLALPLPLELWIKDTFTKALEEAGIPDAHTHEIIIPLHKPGTGNGVLPDLQEDPEFNIRYWVIDSTSMWAGIDRRIDEIFELLWIYFMIDHLAQSNLLNGDEQDLREFETMFMTFLMRRVTKLNVQRLIAGNMEDISTEGEGSKGKEKQAEGQEGKENPANPLVIPNARDMAFMNRWLHERPPEIYRGYQYQVLSSYRESNMDGTPPEGMYWREGIDGTSTEWTEWKEDEQGWVPNTVFKPVPKPQRRRSDDDEDDNDDEDNDNNDDDNDAAGSDNDGMDVDAPRGIKRRRQATDLSEMAGDLDNNQGSGTDAAGESA